LAGFLDYLNNLTCTVTVVMVSLLVYEEKT